MADAVSFVTLRRLRTTGAIVAALPKYPAVQGRPPAEAGDDATVLRPRVAVAKSC